MCVWCMGPSRACLLSERCLFPPVRVTLTEPLGLNLIATARQMSVCGFCTFIFWTSLTFFFSCTGGIDGLRSSGKALGHQHLRRHNYEIKCPNYKKLHCKYEKSSHYENEQYTTDNDVLKLVHNIKSLIKSLGINTICHFLLSLYESKVACLSIFINCQTSAAACFQVSQLEAWPLRRH